MKNTITLSIMAVSAIIAANASAESYFKADIGFDSMAAKYSGVADGVDLDGKKLKPRGNMFGLGVGSRFGDWRGELMLTHGKSHKKMTLTSDEMKVNIDKTTVMLNMYYDKYMGMWSPYVMAGGGYGFYSAQLKHEGGNKLKLKSASGFVANIGFGGMLRLTETVAWDLGLRAGTQFFNKKKKTTEVDADNTVVAKYKIHYTILTGLKVDF